MSDDKPEVHISGMKKSDAYRYMEAVPIAELQNLIREWKMRAYPDGDVCAAELQEVIQEYE